MCFLLTLDWLDFTVILQLITVIYGDFTVIYSGLQRFHSENQNPWIDWILHYSDFTVFITLNFKIQIILKYTKSIIQQELVIASRVNFFCALEKAASKI